MKTTHVFAHLFELKSCMCVCVKINGFYAAAAAFARIFTATAVIVDIIFECCLPVVPANVNATNEDIFAKMVSTHTCTDRQK